MATKNPLQNTLVTLLGGSGFLGNYVAQALLKRGARLRVVSRNPEKSFKLKTLANLGQIQIGRGDITDEKNLIAAITGADAVINLVGVFDGDVKQVMGDAAGNAARIAHEAGVKSFVHISAIGADAASPTGYACAKALGESLVHENFPKASIIRPSVIFGSDDAFINMFAGLIKTAPALPVFGPDATMQPVYVDDVAEAIATALANPAKHGGKIFELGGPEVLTMMDINTRIAKAQHRTRSFIAMPDFCSTIFASLPLTPMTRDQWALLKGGNTASGDYAGFKQLDIEPKPLGLFLDKWMVQHRKHGRFAKANA